MHTEPVGQVPPHDGEERPQSPGEKHEQKLKPSGPQT